MHFSRICSSYLVDVDIILFVLQNEIIVDATYVFSTIGISVKRMVISHINVSTYVIFVHFIYKMNGNIII